MEEFLLPLHTPCVYYDPSFLPATEAEAAYQDLLSNTKWMTSGKINRYVCLMELPHESATDTRAGYQYRDAPAEAVQGFPPTVMKLKALAEQWYNSRQSARDPVKFNVCLLNYYPTGTHRIGYHSDREELSRSTPIASLSLGATRTLSIRSKTNGSRDRVSVDMLSGSLIVMENLCQQRYLHSVLRDERVTEGRINLTFRCKEGEARKMQEVRMQPDGTTAGELEHVRRDQWITQFDEDNEGMESMARGWSFEKRELQTNDKSKISIRVFGDNALFWNHDLHSHLRCSVQYVIKTNIGAECYCAAELDEVLSWNETLNKSSDSSECGILPLSEKRKILARPFGIAGYVALCDIIGKTTIDSSSISCNYESTDTSKNINDAGGYSDWENDPRTRVERILLQLRTAHHVLRFHDSFELTEVLSSSSSIEAETETTAVMLAENGEDEGTSSQVVTSINGEMLYQYYKERLVFGHTSVQSLTELDTGGTFRVTCDRTGHHAFKAPEVEREMGGALSEYYSHIQPKMEDYDVLIRIDVIANNVLIGTQINIDDISKERHFLRFRNAVTIKTNLAYAMVRCANIQDGDLVCDPFCGSGTLLLEALDYYQKRITCVGMDVSRRSANGAKENAMAEGFNEDVCQFYCCDARSFRKHLEEDSVGAIVTNMPWGVMTGHKNVSDLQSLYEVFLRTAWYILKDKGRIVMLVLRGLQLTRIIRKLSGRYRLLNVNVVRTTNNLPCILVVEKLVVDEVRDSVKKQLSFLAQFVNVSSEMYNAVHYEKIDETTL